MNKQRKVFARVYSICICDYFMYWILPFADGKPFVSKTSIAECLQTVRKMLFTSWNSSESRNSSSREDLRATLINMVVDVSEFISSSESPEAKRKPKRNSKTDKSAMAISSYGKENSTGNDRRLSFSRG